MVRILMVEDDATTRQSVGAYLTRAGYHVSAAPDGPSAVATYLRQPADLVLLDLMLPGMSGLELARRLRVARPDLPMIMATALGQEHDRIQGLQHGADDYLVKPYSLRELDLRIRSVLRRSSPNSEVVGTLRDGDLEVDLAAHRVSRDGVELALTARESELLIWFLRHPGTVFSRDELVRTVWGWQAGDSSTVTVHVRRLREKVEDDPGTPRRLITVFGRGYRWDLQDGTVEVTP